MLRSMAYIAVLVSIHFIVGRDNYLWDDICQLVNHRRKQEWVEYLNYIYRQTFISKSVARRRCSKYIFILDLTPGFNKLGKDNCKTRHIYIFGFGALILEVWRYVYIYIYIHAIESFIRSFYIIFWSELNILVFSRVFVEVLMHKLLPNAYAPCNEKTHLYTYILSFANNQMSATVAKFHIT